jgi:hypothetical protein
MVSRIRWDDRQFRAGALVFALAIPYFPFPIPGFCRFALGWAPS